MGRETKRTRKQAKKTDAIKLTIRKMQREKDGRKWTTYLVQGWRENGKWMRKQFKDRQEAERFVALKQVELENEGRAQKLMLCPLSQERLDEAVRAFDVLGDVYTLDECVKFFLRHHRAPDYTISTRDALRQYLDDRELDGLRPRTLQSIKNAILAFIEHGGDPLVHEVSPQVVEAFLRSVRAKDRISKATKRAWNVYRSYLHTFFSWCAEKDATTQRPWTFQNPVAEVRRFSERQVREQQASTPATTSPEDVQRILTTLMRWREGIVLRYFACLYFAGLRPAELERLSDRESELVNFKTGVITIPANISKTRHARQVHITENLRAWLKVAPAPIIPKSFNRLAKQVRAHFKLSPDEARHSFISFHVALHRSIGDVALQAGNSETIVLRHYLNLHPREDGVAFFSIVPDLTAHRAVLREDLVAEDANILKAI